MFFMNYFLVILWACFCQISAPSPPTQQEIVNEQPNFTNENMPMESQKLHDYMQIIKNIDIEQSMESIFELMNMFRLMFPIKFAKVKRTLFNMYDPITNRKFGIAFQALMNMLKDKSTRDKLHTIFQELTIPHSSSELKFNDGRITSAEPSNVEFDSPWINQGTPTDIAKTAELTSAEGNFESPLPTENILEDPVLGISDTKIDHEVDFKKPLEIFRKSGRRNPFKVNELDQLTSNFLPTRIQRKDSGEIDGGLNVQSELTRRPQNSITEPGNLVEKFEELTPSISHQQTDIKEPNVVSEEPQKLSGVKAEFEGLDQPPSQVPQKSSGMKAEFEGLDQSPSQVPEANVLQQTPANSPTENLETKNQETELRLARMKRFLDKVKNNKSASASLQAKAAIISRLLAKEEIAAS